MQEQNDALLESSAQRNSALAEYEYRIQELSAQNERLHLALVENEALMAGSQDHTATQPRPDKNSLQQRIEVPDTPTSDPLQNAETADQLGSRLEVVQLR